MNNCVFCEITAGVRDPELRVYEDEDVIAQMSLHQKPGNHGHVLVLPRDHIQNIYDMPDALNTPLMAALRLLSRAVKRAFAAEGIHIRQNNELAAGQDVFHLHFHIVPRYGDDAFDTTSYELLSLARRKELAERLKPMVERESKLAPPV